jgi:catechol 2,3-dioxygenase-like lactoylglutathione lyase family enzyme
VGEDVSVFREDGTARHDTRPSLPLEGEWTLAGFCDHLATLELWPEPPEWEVALRPDGTDMFEVVRFHSPSAGAQELAPAANRPGLRHVAFKVDDVRGVVDRVREAGWETVGEIVDFENTFLLCYVRGPEGLIVELAERLDGAPG